MADEREIGLQEAAEELAYAFRVHDEPHLAKLTGEQFEVQMGARRALYAYVDQMWLDAKRQGLNPAMRPEWASVAALRDLALHLETTAREESSRRDDADR